MVDGRSGRRVDGRAARGGCKGPRVDVQAARGRRAGQQVRNEGAGGAGGAGARDPLPGTVLVEVAVDSCATRGAASGGAASRGAEPGGAELGGTEPLGAEPVVAASEGAEPGVAESEGAESGGAERGSYLSRGGPPGALSRREPLALHEWFARRTRLRSGAVRAGGSAAGGTGAAGAGGAARVGARGTGAGAARVTGAAGLVGARTRCTRAAGAGGAAGIGAGGTGVGAAGFGGARTGGTGTAGDGGAARVGARGTGAGAAGVTGAAGFGGARTEGTGAAGAGGAARVGAGDTGAGGAGPGGAGAVGAGSGDTGRPRSQTPLQPASPLPAPSPYTEQTGGLTERREPVSRPASPLRAVRTGRRVPRPRPPPVPGMHHMALRPSSVPKRVPLPSPPATSMADGPDPESDLARAASPTVPRVLATVVTNPSFESAAASALVTELVDFAAVCRLDYATALVAQSGSACPPSIGGECALGTDVLEDRQEDFESLAAARDYELHSLDIITAFLQGSLHEEIWLRCPPGFTGLRQAPRKWYDRLRTTLAALGFAPSTADPSLFLRTDTSLPPFYVVVYVKDLVFATADTEALALVRTL
ncbi:unnamed protein product [Closterium sp. NIES-53]